MLSTSELLAAHHDAKLLSDARKRQAGGEPSRRPYHPFRPGLRVKVDIGEGQERRVRVTWADGDPVTETP
jgi:hypothetical protein